MNLLMYNSKITTMEIINNSVYLSQKLISPRLGVMQNIITVSKGNGDPNVISMGIKTGDTRLLGGEFYAGRSSGCALTLEDAFLSTVGETVERYSCAFYDVDNFTFSDYKHLKKPAIHPSEFALYHEEQHKFYASKKYKMKKFTEDIEVFWDECYDLANSSFVFCPAAFIYLPWSADTNHIIFGSSNGLSAHTNYYKALLTSLFEVIERDSFVITWHQQIHQRKIIITNEIQQYINNIFPSKYEWHLFDITYDLNVPTVLGICFGKAEYGDFVIVGTATRATMGEAVKKVILEVSQSIPYYRFLAKTRKDWKPDEDFNKILDFEEHSLFYNRSTEHNHVFDVWRNAEENTKIDFSEKNTENPKNTAKRIIKIFKEKQYNVLLKDLTTADVNQANFYCLKIVVPQLLQMSGAYPFYHLGGKRLYEVPLKVGLPSKAFSELNKYPHPFP